jgi:hypothetical protein
MFEKQRDYFRVLSKEYGLKREDAEMISIKLANVSTDIYFTDEYYKKKITSEY